jgi:hypothetical protein
MWIVSFSGGIMLATLPDSQGGVGDTLRSDWTEEEIQNGKPHKMEGKVVQFGGLPPMYDWEHSPQILPRTGILQKIERNFAR